jgi:UDP-N-acetylglucosamine 1-carboxyvinyltransferase
MTVIDDAPLTQVGALIRGARQNRGLTQTQLAERLGTSQSAVHRIEQGAQNLSLEMLNRISLALDSEIISLGGPKHAHLRVQGGHTLSGRIEVNSSKNGAVALLCASLLNRGRTTLRGVARIVEVDRIVDVLRSIGVRATWTTGGRDLEIVVPDQLDLAAIDVDAARRSRSGSSVSTQRRCATTCRSWRASGPREPRSGNARARASRRSSVASTSASAVCRGPTSSTS